jgi:MoxR-like ATPase
VTPDSNARLHALAQSMRTEIEKVVTGQQAVIEQVLIAFLAAGHVIVEGLPGLGKTLLVRALAQTFGAKSTRVQFTPDLMPSDILGHSVFNMQSGKFEMRRGPVFTHLLIADEINRAPAKTQAAVLEVMQERQVTLDGATHVLEAPFMALATQNPLEHEGTYPLPDAQLDRFLLKIQVNYPSAEEELAMLERLSRDGSGDVLSVSAISAVASIADVLALQSATSQVHVDREILDYSVRLVRATREWPGIAVGAGPRGGLALIRAARARAFLQGRDFVLPEDIKAMAPAVLRHRLTLTPDMELERRSSDHLLRSILETVQAPRK